MRRWSQSRSARCSGPTSPHRRRRILDWASLREVWPPRVLHPAPHEPKQVAAFHLSAVYLHHVTVRSPFAALFPRAAHAVLSARVARRKGVAIVGVPGREGQAPLRCALAVGVCPSVIQAFLKLAPGRPARHRLRQERLVSWVGCTLEWGSATNVSRPVQDSERARRVPTRSHGTERQNER
jgi:hypothetical protein